MKICPNCGNQVADDALFCNNCGTNVANLESAPENAKTADESIVASETIGAAASAANVTGGAFSGAAQAQDFGNAQELGNAQDIGQPEIFSNDQMNYQNQYRSYDPSDHTAEFDPRDIADNKLFAVLPYFTLLYGLIISLLIKESAFCKFHAKNALRLKIASFLALIPAIIPLLGWFVSAILFLILVVINIVAIIQCFQGKAKDLPIISNIGFLR
ncbi:MAG: zinc-ribbon domain-containing protein [Butyrivibrio sp.]|nr:zinc-ribbon domain-containing protein [Butyrivibrio sp.]